jgi:uncharacterized protein
MTDASPASAPEAPLAGTFVWQELVTPDPAKAGDFFARLFGWTLRAMDMGEHGHYRIAHHGGRDIAGIMAMDGPMWQGIPPHWMAYLAVDDVDASCAAAQTLGGKVCVAPFDVPNVGRIAVINDPTGAAVSLITFAARPEEA